MSSVCAVTADLNRHMAEQDAADAIAERAASIAADLAEEVVEGRNAGRLGDLFEEIELHSDTRTKLQHLFAATSNDERLERLADFRDWAVAIVRDCSTLQRYADEQAREHDEEFDE